MSKKFNNAEDRKMFREIKKATIDMFPIIKKKEKEPVMLKITDPLNKIKRYHRKVQKVFHTTAKSFQNMEKQQKKNKKEQEIINKQLSILEEKQKIINIQKEKLEKKQQKIQELQEKTNKVKETKYEKIQNKIKKEETIKQKIVKKIESVSEMKNRLIKKQAIKNEKKQEKQQKKQEQKAIKQKITNEKLEVIKMLINNQIINLKKTEQYLNSNPKNQKAMVRLIEKDVRKNNKIKTMEKKTYYVESKIYLGTKYATLNNKMELYSPHAFSPDDYKTLRDKIVMSRDYEGFLIVDGNDDVYNNMQNGIFDDHTKKIIYNKYDLQLPKSYAVFHKFSTLFYKVKPLDANYQDIKLKRTALKYKILGDEKPKVFSEGMCVPDFVFFTMYNTKKFPKLNKLVFVEQIKNICSDFEENGMSLSEIKSLMDTYYKNQVNIFVMDPFFKLIDRVTVPCSRHICSLFFIINNNHLYGIQEEEIKSKIRNLKTGELMELTKVDWNTFDNNNKIYDNVNDDIINGNFKENQIGITINNLASLVENVAKQTSYIPIHLNINSKSQVSAFIHPINNCYVYAIGDDYHERKRLCEEMYKLNPCQTFVFRNQSYTQLVNGLFKIKYGLIQKSFNSEVDKEIYSKFNTTQIVKTYQNIKKDNNCFGFDVRASYRNAVLNMTENYPIFAITNVFEEYNGEDIVLGEYIVDDIVVKISESAELPIKKMVYPYNLVKYMLENNHITKSNILYVKKASEHLEKEVLTNFIKYILTDPIITSLKKNEYNEKNEFVKSQELSKCLCNSFFGSFGKKENKTVSCALTDSFDFFAAAYNYYHHDEVQIDQINDIYFMRLTNKTKLTYNHGGIHRSIIGGGIINLINMLKYTCDNNTEIIGVNTDSCFLRNPRITTVGDNHLLYKDEEWKPKIYRQEEPYTREVKIDNHKRNWTVLKYDADCIDLPENKDNIVHYNKDNMLLLDDVSFICNQPGGFGKSTMSNNLYKNGKYTSNATICFANNLKTVADMITNGFTNAYTLASYFEQFGNTRSIPSHVKKIVIDEFTQISLNFYNMIYEIKRQRPEIIIQMYGDQRQCKAVGNPFYVDYINKIFMKKLVNYNQLVLAFHKKARYDAKAKNIHEEFYETGKLPNIFKPIDPKLETNIVYYNRLRENINFNLFQNHNQQLYVGQVIIAKCNSKKLKIYNSALYKITSINGRYIKFSNEFDDKEITEEYVSFDKYFELGYATTIFKRQGSTIKEEYNIYNCETFSKNEMGTALTRATNIENIHLDWDKIKDKVFVEYKENNHSIVNNPNPAKKACIYEITDGELYYIGQTCKKNINKRLAEHLEDTSSQIFIQNVLKKRNWTIKKLVDVYWTFEKSAFIPSKYAVNEAEMYWIRKYKTLYGEKLINKLGNGNKEIKEEVKKMDENNKLVENAMVDENTFKILKSNDYFCIKKKIGSETYRKLIRFDADNVRSVKMAYAQMEIFTKCVYETKLKNPELKYKELKTIADKEIEEKVKQGTIFINFDDD